MGEYMRGVCSVVLVALLFIAPGLMADGAWVPPKDKATKAEEKQIFQGCALKAEYVFYAAQEKIYNHGNTEKLMIYLRDNMSAAEFAVNGELFKWIGEWVDAHSYTLATDYARALFYECITNSYEHFQKAPTERAHSYIERFEQTLESTEERLLPNDGTELEA